MADLSESLKWEYINYYKENKVLQYTVNGIYRFLILWIIKHNPKIHGYAIMKEMDNFFDSLINEGSLNKSNPSKIYPILSKMEDEDLIKHSFEINDKKEIKIYEITPKGDFLLEFIREKYIKIKKTPEGNLFFEEFLNQEWSYLIFCCFKIRKKKNFLNYAFFLKRENSFFKAYFLKKEYWKVKLILDDTKFI